MSSAAARSGRAWSHGAPALSASRVCLWCGGALVQRRAGARFCGASCRREHNRVSRLLSGQRDGRYANLAAYDGRRRNRAQRAPEPLRSVPTTEMPRRRENAPGPATEVEAPTRPEPTSAAGADDASFLRRRDKEEVA